MGWREAGRGKIVILHTQCHLVAFMGIWFENWLLLAMQLYGNRQLLGSMACSKWISCCFTKESSFEEGYYFINYPLLNRLPWSALFQPVIDMCRNGFPMTAHTG